ncbi:unnamed protein product [Orchesella dallaii]
MPEDFLTFERPFGLQQHVFNRIGIGGAHALSLYYNWLWFCDEVPNTVLYEIFFGYVGGFGITIGCHRYWTHKTFKATLPFQILLMICQTIAFQHPIRKWCVDHRIHHKYTDTNKDPHNSKRGFWFSHIGWLLLPKHPDLVEEIKNFDASDLDNNLVVRFQSKWYWPLSLVFFLMLPIITQMLIWPEMTYFQCFASNMRRLTMSNHFTFCVNSVAHIWGDKPYDGGITATQNALVSLLTVGEGWHNYHHTFPWDYRTSEFGWRINMSTIFIDFFALIGWAYDLKTVSPQFIEKRVRSIQLGEKMRSFSDNEFSLQATFEKVNEDTSEELIATLIK